MSTAIDPKNAFAHLVYEYRCLVMAQLLYNKSKDVDNIVKESKTVGRNAVLLKSRSLTEFYTRTKSKETDITAKEYFDFSLKESDNLLYDQILKVYRSIEVHEIHITTWRDEGYRNSNKTDEEGIARQRIDWNEEQPFIVNNLIDVLNVWQKKGDSWTIPVRFLHDTCKKVLSECIDWPPQLSKLPSIVVYLTELGL
jgi:hypothetical protein